MRKFWNWTNNQEERVLLINGTIAEESWWDDEVTPKIFKEELLNGSGDITLWINSPGGDCIAAAQIYNMLIDYKGDVTVKIDGIAASAASVIAMAGTKVIMSPVSMVMIHNPATIAWGDHSDMKRTINMLDEVKESIMNAYEIKTGMARNKLSKLMDDETWMNANSALELGFADEIIERTENVAAPVASMIHSTKAVNDLLSSKIAKNCEIKKDIEPTQPTNTVTADSLMNRLELMKNWRN